MFDLGATLKLTISLKSSYSGALIAGSPPPKTISIPISRKFHGETFTVRDKLKNGQIDFEVALAS